jgi:hypothetical protein
MDPFLEGTKTGGPGSVIHKHSHAIAFSIFRSYSLFQTTAPGCGGTALQSGSRNIHMQTRGYHAPTEESAKVVHPHQHHQANSIRIISLRTAPASPVEAPDTPPRLSFAGFGLFKEVFHNLVIPCGGEYFLQVFHRIHRSTQLISPCYGISHCRWLSCPRPHPHP